jgi:prophage regulatory protein
MDELTTTRPPKPPAPDSSNTPLFIRIGVVMRLTGLGRSTIYRMMAEDAFPQPVRLTRRLIAWRRTDLDRWSDARPRVAH